MPSLQVVPSPFPKGTKVLKSVPSRGKSEWIEGEVLRVKTTVKDGEMYVISYGQKSQKKEAHVSKDDIEWMVLAKKYYNQRVAKDFGEEDGGVFEGSVIDIKPPDDENEEGVLFTVLYDDEDVEDLDQSEIEKALELYKDRREKRERGKKRKMDKAKSAEPPKVVSSPEEKERPAKVAKSTEPPKVVSSPEEKERPAKVQRSSSKAVKSSTPIKLAPIFTRRARPVVSYREASDNEDDEEPEEPPPKPTATRKRAPTTKANTKTIAKKVKKGGDDSDASVASVDSEDSDDLVVDSSDDESFDQPAKSKSKRTKAATTTKARGKTAKASADAEPKKKTMAESFEPMNRPLFHNLSLAQIKAEKQYLDPCGREATDDIIGRLVGEQLEKIQGLLLRALKSNNHLGSEKVPLKMGTACSGTDAPSLALTLLQEQMEMRGLENLLKFDHTFSCEVEPFKQAYLARNFDSVLYPDICKLSDEEPRDVYGQVQPIPEHNIFVAGTSCKNFSMLRANKRLDIEDKGCSGETFLAAVEHMFKEQPPYCILENVQGAPWDKMAEYIEGKIKLSSCAETKAITGVKRGDKQVLEFVEQDGKIIVDKVPTVFGVRCGSSVAGYSKPGESKIHPIKWPKGKKGRCTLEDLISENKISKANDTVVFDVPIRYHTARIKVDTKDYGLPQTRNRMYLFVWRAEYGADLGDYWKLIVEHLKSPVRHSLEAFVLQDDHDIIRVFREALRGPSGRQTKRERFLERDFWTSSSANLPHNKTAREKLGLEDETRAITNWGPHGKKKLPPHYWTEFLNCCSQRELDVIDILHASAARDAESHDSSFSSFVWNISQNASREKHRTATPGISGCVTPGGEFFLPHLGRPLLGCEKLLLQGIPYFRLALGTETEVQLGDLAGNAMSLTVVGATLIAAIACKQLRAEAQKNNFLSNPLNEAQKILKSSAVKRTPGEEAARANTDEMEDAIDFFKKLSGLADEALSTSIWCTCETSGQNSTANVFLQCQQCKVSCCRICCDSTAGYQLDSHDVVEKVFTREERDIGKFDAKLRNVLPPTITFSKDSLAELPKGDVSEHDVTLLAGLNFNLHKISRERRAWKITYFARENQVGEALAEVCISVGEFSSADSKGIPNRGANAELRSFLPALVPPLKYGLLDPIATFKCIGKASLTDHQKWVGREYKTTACSLKMVGSQPGPSFRSEVGLTEVAEEGVNSGAKQSNNQKHFQDSKKRGEERRWIYAENWESWPEKIEIEAPKGTKVEQSEILGTYKRCKCRQSINQGAVWMRQELPRMYILIKPEVSRTGPDAAIISRSIAFDDSSEVIATLPDWWQPSDALLPKNHLVDNIRIRSWSLAPDMRCLVRKSSISVSSPAPGSKSDVLLTIKGLSRTDTEMLAFHAGENTNAKLTLPMATGQRAQQTIRAFNSICVSKILQYASSNAIAFDIRPGAEWRELRPFNGSPAHGFCTKTFPKRPKERWIRNEERNDWDRIYEAGESRAFYQALENRPHAFGFELDKPSGTLTVRLNPHVVAHYAAGHLTQGRGLPDAEDVKVSVLLSASQYQSDPVLDAFRVPNCHSEDSTEVRLKSPFQLYERQKRVVTKMRAIEDGKTIFNETEMYEEHMPGSTGWSIIAKAQRDAKISGGVIADAIGAGKTVISIALILHGLEESRKKSNAPRQSSATLVVVPSHLIGQWKSEIAKFTTGLRVICIYDLKSLKNCRVRDILEADCVICPVDILESDGYLLHLLQTSGYRDYLLKTYGHLDEKPKPNCAGECVTPKMPPYVGQQESSGALGVWIPAGSADPYGGLNNSNNQKRRNASARYSHVYLNSIYELRNKDFPTEKKGVPLEYFEWERIIVDEIHESLCCTKKELDTETESGGKAKDVFKERNRRAGRELLGIMTKDPKQRPLVPRKAIFGLTGTPLLDSPNRVIELASMIGCTYVLGLSSHWRKLERESCRDIFLHYYLEPKQSRLIRRNLYEKCQDYISTACCRNKVGDEMKGISLKEHILDVKMNEAESELYLQSQSGIPSSKKSFAISPEDFDVSAGHDITKFLRQNIDLECRKKKLIEICHSILDKDPTTKIVVFADGRVGGGVSAREALQADKKLGCTWLDGDDSIEERNQKIAWYQHGDATDEDRARPRILVLHFEHAAGLNLQSECYNMILYSPLYVGSGGTNSDPVSDVSTELQAMGRVYRPGQTNPVVNLYRIEVRGPKGEECLDGRLIRRNTDEETKSMAVNAED